MLIWLYASTACRSVLAPVRKYSSFATSWIGFRLASAPRILILNDTSRCGSAGVAAEVLLQPVEDQAVLDLLRLPDVGVEGLVGVVDVRQQAEQLEHVAVHLELDPGEIVDDVTVPPGDQMPAA